MTSEKVAFGGGLGAKYFQADDDKVDAMDNDDETKLPSWRGDPEYTHSDWTIVVNEENTHHVHKFILVTGLRSCNYFATLFRTTVPVSELQNNTSRITLPNDQAEAFPIMLDFVYSSSESSTLDEVLHTDNALALRSLARYFGCTALMKSVNGFIQQDLSTKTAVSYLHKAFQNNDEKLEESARKLIVENYRRIPTASIESLPYELFRSVICSSDLKYGHQDKASMDIQAFFEANPDVLNAHSLNELTNHLSQVYSGCAESLLKMVADLVPDEQDETSFLALDKLCKLCADSLAGGWKDVDTNKSIQDFYNPCVKGDYRGSGRLVIPRLAASLERAQEVDEFCVEEADRNYEELRRLHTESKDHKRENALQKKRIEELEARNAELELLIPPAPNHLADRRLKRTRPT